MLNQIVLVGRLTSNLKVTKSKTEEVEYCNLCLAIPRSFKNKDGEYETDFIYCKLYNNIATNTAEYCKKGDIVGIKGRLQNVGKQVMVIAEKVTFLSSKEKEDVKHE